MRTLTGDEQDLYEGAGIAVLMRVRLRESATSSTYYDLTSLEGEDFLISVTVDEDQDSRFARATFQVKREIYRLSLAELMTGSKLNGAQSLLKSGRECVVEMQADPAGSWHEVFRGDIIEPDWSAPVIQVEALDMGHRLQRMFLEVERQHGSTGGVDAEDVIQQIIDDGHGQPYAASYAYVLGNRVHPTTRNGYWYEVTTAGTSGAEPAWPTTIGNTVTSGGTTFTNMGAIPELYVPASPSFVISPAYIQPREPVFDAIFKIAQLFGWDLRYRWDTVTSAFRLTLFEPDRTKSAADFTWHPDTTSGGVAVPSYLGIDECSLGWQDVRNVIQVVYTTSAGVRSTVERSDASSITKYERRWMQIAEAASSRINTSGEAQTMADAILADLKDPLLSHRVALPLFPFAQLGDLYEFKANGVHYDSDQSLAVVGIRHSMQAGRAGETVVSCRGKPVASVREWLVIEARPGVAPSPPLVGPDAPTGLSASRVVGGVVVTFTPPVVGDAVEYELHLSTSSGFTPDSSTRVATTSTDRFEVSNLTPGTTYYAVVRGIDAAGNPGTVSAQTSIPAGYVEPIEFSPDMRPDLLPLNGAFEFWTGGATVVPDRWSMHTGTWDTDADRTTGSESGQYAVLLNTTAVAAAIQSEFFPVSAGARTVAVGKAKLVTASGTAGDDGCKLSLIFYEADKSTVVSTVTDVGGTAGTGNWDMRRIYTTVPSAAKFARLRWEKFDTSATSLAFAWAVDRTEYVEEFEGAWNAVGSFSNSWVNFGGSSPVAAYRRNRDGTVFVRGVIKDGTVGVTAFSLPHGYRPGADMEIPAVSRTGGGTLTAAVLKITATLGLVSPLAGSNGEFHVNACFSADG